jgi:hypothetical protein
MVVFIVRVVRVVERARWSAMLDGIADQPLCYIRTGIGHEWDLGTWETYWAVYCGHRGRRKGCPRKQSIDEKASDDRH